MATYFWVGGSGTWDNSNSANWSLTTGGAGGAGVPNGTDTVNFDANSGTGTCTTAATAASSVVTQNSATLVLVLGANLTISGRFTLTQGSVDLAGFTMSALELHSNNTNTRSIAFGSGKIVVTGTGLNFYATTLTNLVFTGTPVVDLTYAGASAMTVRWGNSGGATTANVPTVNFTAGTYALSLAAFTLDLNFSGYAGAMTSASIGVYGSLALGSGMTVAASTVALTMQAVVTGKTITSNSVSMDCPLVFNGVGGGWSLVDNLAIGTSRALTLTNGSFDADGKNVSTGSFTLGAGTKTLTLGSGTWTVVGSGTAWNANTNVANLTVSPSSGIISMTSASAKTFAGGAKAWPTLNQGGSGALTIQQSNSFANITNTVQPATITFTTGTTQTVGALGVSGTSGNLITLNSSTAGSRATLIDRFGVNEVSFVSIKDINAVGGSLWYAPKSAGNVDAGNNYGWNFSRALKRVFSTVFKPIFRPIFS